MRNYFYVALSSIISRIRDKFFDGSNIKPRPLSVLIFTLFTSITILIGVLIVVFTSPRPSKICQHAFKRIGKSSVVSSSRPRSIAVGDFNNDNRTDIVVANSGTDTIGIFLSYSNGTLQGQQTYSTGPQSRPYSVVVNDFNNDNHLDIAVANYGTNSIGVFLGLGNGMFTAPRIVSTGPSRPLFITSGDINNDNRSDIVVTNYGTDTIGIFLGFGDGYFQEQIIVFTGYDSLLYSLDLGDLNEDGYLDIVIVNYKADTMGIFLGYGNGSFENQKTYTTTPGSNPMSVAIGDFNNDNHQDIAVANSNIGSVCLFFGFGNGTFMKQTTYSISSTARLRQIALGDFNQDNRPDIAVVDAQNDQVHILLVHGNSTRITITTYDTIVESHPFSIAIGHFDEDNQTDLAVVNYGTNNVLVLTGYTFQPSARQKNYSFGSSSRPGSVVVSDFNKNNRLDMVALGIVKDSVLRMTDYDNGTFARYEEFLTGADSLPQQLCVSDLNNDNRSDIVTVNLGSNSVSVLLGQDNGMFASPIIYPAGVGSMPKRLVIYDVNNDHQLDIVIAHRNTDSVGVFLGYGNGSFSSVRTFSTGINSRPYAIAVGDINNDQKPDILTANHDSDSISILLGDSNTTFNNASWIFLAANSGPISIVLLDLNNDHHLDMVVASSMAGNLHIFLGNGNGYFHISQTYSFGQSSLPSDIIIIDYNHDNIMDIALCLSGVDKIVLGIGNGNGSFDLARTFFTGSGSHPNSVAIADFDNNGRLEIVVTLWGTSEIAILTEYIAAQFVSETTYSTGSNPQPYSVTIGDFNRDNRSDIVVANSGTDNLGIRLGLGDGTFESPRLYSTGIDSHPQYVVSGDLNNDDQLDIIVAHSKHDSISTMLGYGNGTFASGTVYSIQSGANPSAIVLGDLNNDNRADLITTNTGTDSITVYIQYDYALFETPTTYKNTENIGPRMVITGDFNNDTYLDIAVTFLNSGTLGILLNRGNGSFDYLVIHPQGINSLLAGLVAGDINNDGTLDIAITDLGAETLVIFLGYGNGTFAIPMNFPTGNDSWPLAIAMADFNKDGCLDVAVTNFMSDEVGILLGYGNGSFATIVTYATGNGSHPFAIAIHDFNQDDQLDIAVVNRDTSSVGIFLGLGGGHFGTQSIYLVGSFSVPISIAVADLNGDGYLDIITANFNDNSVSVLSGYGNGSFSPIAFTKGGSGTTPMYVTVGDFNNDQQLDVAVVNRGTNDVLVYFGSKRGAFYNGNSYSTGNRTGPLSMAFGDFNNDNRLDFVTANYYTNDIGVFLGYGNEPFGGGTTYSTGSGSKPYAAGLADFNNDGHLDLVTTNYGAHTVHIYLINDREDVHAMKLYSTGNGSTPCAVAVGDLNNDNCSDIVVANCETDNLFILLGFGNGTFTAGMTYSTGSSSRPHSVVIADFDNDYRMDIAVANSGANNILILYGDGDGTFGKEKSYSLGYDYRPYSIVVDDLNGDSWMDIVIACYNTDQAEVLMNTCL